MRSEFANLDFTTATPVSRVAGPKMISISRATSLIKTHALVLGHERIDLADAVGRVLGEDVIADTDLPPFDRSQMDGYAVVSDDTSGAPVTLKIMGESAAGKGWHKTLKRGHAVRIMTGAPVPPGADAVVKVELTRSTGKRWEDSSEVVIGEPVRKGTSIVRRGAEIKKGKHVLSIGTRLTASNIAVPAAFGYSKIKVSRRPRVAVMSTGSEIVEINRKPGRDQIRNSNSLMLKTLAEANGGIVEIFPIASDDILNLRYQISNAAKGYDILVITGGVSVGKYDLTKAALLDLGAEIYFEKVRLKPGKPTVFARLGRTLVFGLPGNPVSAAVTFNLFARHAMLLMQGSSETQMRKMHAVITSNARAAKERDSFLPAITTTGKNGNFEATTLTWQGSSDFIGFGGADCLIYLPKGTTAKAGDVVEIRKL